MFSFSVGCLFTLYRVLLMYKTFHVDDRKVPMTEIPFRVAPLQLAHVDTQTYRNEGWQRRWWVAVPRFHGMSLPWGNETPGQAGRRADGLVPLPWSLATSEIKQQRTTYTERQWSPAPPRQTPNGTFQRDVRIPLSRCSSAADLVCDLIASSDEHPLPPSLPSLLSAVLFSPSFSVLSLSRAL